MTNGPRLLLVIATQCREMPWLGSLHEAAARLSESLLEPSMGACVPALPDGTALAGGRPGHDEVEKEVIQRLISQAADEADRQEATLVIALLGHGITPGPTLHLMGADSRDDRGDSAVNVPQVLGYAVNRRGINGVIAIIDTCGAAAALPHPQELTMGVRGGHVGLAILAAAGAQQDAYDLRLSRTLADVITSGIDDAPATLLVPRIGRELDSRIPGQSVMYNEYAGGPSMTDTLWVSHNQSGHLRKEPQAEWPDDRRYHSMCLSYLRWAADDWRYIDLGDLGLEESTQARERIQRLQLRSMYISLQADPRSVTDRRREEELRRRDEVDLDPETTRSIMRSEVSAILTRRPGASMGTDASSMPGVSLEDAFARHRVLVVLGHPGSGKSVLCQWLGLRLARRARETLQSGGSGALLIPLRFRAADYARFYATQFANGDPPGSVSAFLASMLEKPVGYPARKLQGMFERALADGEATLLIDGLDELADRRSEVIDALTAAVDTYIARRADGLGQAVITSRIAGYNDIYLASEEAAHYIIRPMSERQVSEFVVRFFDQMMTIDQSAPFLEYLASANTDVVRRLATTPLLLTSMCSYWHRHHRLPASRAELYRRLLIDMSYLWRDFPAASGNADLDQLLGDESDFLAMLARVAVRIHDEYADGRISLDDFLEALDEALFGSGRFTDRDIRPISKLLIERICEKVGILAEFANGEFGFIHQTFREYLAGLDLLNRSGDPGNPGHPQAEILFKEFKTRTGDPRWREPILMALGECATATRTELMRLAYSHPEVDLEEWSGLFLEAALERPIADSTATELTTLLKLTMRTCAFIRGMPTAIDELDIRLAQLRRHLGQKQFDLLAMNLLGEEDRALTAPIAALFWRRQWLTPQVLAAFAGAAQCDSAEWNWPIQRSLRRAANPRPRREITIQPSLDRPLSGSDEESRTAVRLFELGQRPWEQRRKLADEVMLGPVPRGALPLRDFFLADPGRWSACVSNPGSARVLAALFGGLDYQDARSWVKEYDDFERLLSQPNSARNQEIERRAAQLVPRFGVGDIVYAIAVQQIETGDVVSYSAPAPVIGPEWLTGSSTPLIRDVIRRCFTRAPGDADQLRRSLDRLATPQTPAADRAEAQLGLLVLDGRPMTADMVSIRALERAFEATSDAMIRSHAAWFGAVWNPQVAMTSAERAAMHRFLLRAFFCVTGEPVPLTPDPLVLGEPGLARHPVLWADQLARTLLTPAGDEEPVDLGITQMPAEKILAVLAWFTTLPYQHSPDSRIPGVAALWHETMPRALSSLTGLEAAVGPILAWAHQHAPRLEPQLSEVAAVALRSAGERRHQDGPSPVPPAAEELWRAGRGTVKPGLLQQMLEAAAAAPAPQTDLAFVLMGLSGQVPEQQRPDWHLAALELLNSDPDLERRAEAFCRMRGSLSEVVPVQRSARQFLAGIDSPLLRAEATGELSQTAAALISAVGRHVDQPAQISLLTFARVAQELTRVCKVVLRRDGELAASSAAAANDGGWPGASKPWLPPLNQATLDAMSLGSLSAASGDEAAAEQLSRASGIAEEAVPILAKLAEEAPNGARWAAIARNLLMLQRATSGPGYAGMFRDLGDMVYTADAATSAKARLALLGPRSAAERETRHYLLSRYGVDRWWELGQNLMAETDHRYMSLFEAALQEWDVDDPLAVTETIRRAGESEHGRAVWLKLVNSASIWRTDTQIVLAEWLGAGPADAGVAEACLDLATMLQTAGNSQCLTHELLSAVAAACAASRTSVRSIPSLASGEWRLEVAGTVATACSMAIAAGATGTAAVHAARSRLVDLTGPVVESAAGLVTQDLASYGSLFWIKLGSHPADAAKFVSAELDAEKAISLLVAWAQDLDAENAGATGSSALSLATFEAVLNLLVITSAREERVFRLCCPPPVMQPVFSRAVLHGHGLTGTAGLILLGRLRFVDLHPSEGPGLIEIMDRALRADARMQEAVSDFLSGARHVRSRSLVSDVAGIIRQSPNETVVQGFAGLAASYLSSSSCTSAERKQIHQLLKCDGQELGRRRATLLAGVGSESDPVTAVPGPDRRSEFARLRRYAGRVEPG